jgi:phosphatidylserine/phosphatidylglycerophosphate/cardiolipin synthase-like enzyme
MATRIFARVRGTAGDGAAAYAIVGSQNQDYRGMFMDGEVGVMLTGSESLVVLVDLVFLEGAVVWLDDRATLDRLLRRPGPWERRLARVATDAV